MIDKQELIEYIVNELTFPEKYAEDIMEEAIKMYYKYGGKIRLIDQEDPDSPCSYIIGGYSLDDWFRYSVSVIFEPYTISEIVVWIIKRNTILINGSLWVNSAKYEYVDKIIITKEEVLIYYKGKEIGSILKSNIHTLVQQKYEEKAMINLKNLKI